jgi:hypothetical protein
MEIGFWRVKGRRFDRLSVSGEGERRQRLDVKTLLVSLS